MGETTDDKPPWYGTATGRTPTGAFAKGNKLASGNPVAKQMHARRSALLDWTTEDDAREVWQGIVADAKSGDPVARKLFCDYVFGRPVQGIELTAVSSEDASTELGRVKLRLAAFADRLPLDQRYELAAFLAESPDGETIEPRGAINGPGNGNDSPA